MDPMEMVFMVVLGFVLCLVVYLFFYHFYKPYFLGKEAYNMRGPRPVLWYGNFHSFVKYGIGCKEYWATKYGAAYLYYLGIRPFIYTREINMARTVLLSKASCFIDRPPSQFTVLIDKTGNLRSIINSTGEKWRRMHRMLAPVFSKKKIKLSSPSIEVCCGRLIEHLTTLTDSSVDLIEIFGTYTTEVILSTAFGRDINSKEGMGKKLCEAVYTVFNPISDDIQTGPQFIEMLVSHCSWFLPILHLLARRSKLVEMYDLIKGFAEQVVRDRKMGSNESRRNDLLQLLIDASDEEVESKTGNMIHVLSDDEVIDNVVLFIVVGNNTTRNALALVAYMLAINPEIQTKLVNEINNYFSNKPHSSLYDAAESIKYTEMIVLETLRIYPPAESLGRLCIQTCAIDECTIIEKGTIIEVAVNAVNKNPSYWPDPDKFNPERFNPEHSIDPLTFLSFGAGPRICIGRTLALTNIKIALVAIMRKFKFELADDTEIPLEIMCTSSGDYKPKNGVKLKITLR